jgi:choice-of-anchor A domain-containing protein
MYGKRKLLIFNTALLAFGLFFTEGVSQNPFSSINNFNVFTEGNVVMAGGDVEGGIAAGGNFTINGSAQITANNAGTGNVYGTIGGVNYGLVVNGSVIYSSGQFNVNANGSNHWLKIGNANGGSVTLSGSNLRVQNGAPFIQANNTNQGTGTVIGSGLMNYSAVMTTMRNFSNGYAGCSNNIAPSFDIGNPTTPKLTLAANARNVWNITGATLASYTGGITFNNQPTQTQPLIINVNVTGTFNWTVPNMNGIGRTNGARYIIWNFYNVSTLNVVGGQTVEGSMLVPNGALNKTHSANIEGQIVAASYTQTAGEVHVAHFDATPAVCSTCSNVTSAGNISTSQSICGASLDPSALTETSAPSGGSGALEYQWRISLDNVNWSDIGGATPSISATRYYQRGVRRQGCAPYLYSNSVSAVVNVSATISASNTGAYCTGATIQLNSNINQGLGSVNWTGPSSFSASGQNVTRGSATTAMSGTYTANYTAPNGCTASATTNVTVNSGPTTANAGSDKQNCNSGSFTMTGNTPSVGTGNWSVVAGTATIGASNSPTSSITGVPAGTTATLRWTISNSCGNSADDVILTNFAQPTANAGVDQTTCINPVTLNANSPPSGGSGLWTVVSGTASIAASNNASTNVTVTGTATLRWTITNGLCSAFDDVVATVGIAPTISTQPTGFTQCVGGSQTVSVVASNAASYQWQSSPNNSTWTNIGSATGTSYTPPAAAAGTTYYRVVVNANAGCSNIVSNAATVVIVNDPSVSITATASGICVGGNVTLNATPNGGTGTCTVQWQSFNGSIWNNIAGATGNNYTTPALSAQTRYRAQVNCSGNGCCN